MPEPSPWTRARAASAPRRAERPATLGVICDVTRVADPMEAAMALSECSRLPAARRGMINWLGDLAAAFVRVHAIGRCGLSHTL